MVLFNNFCLIWDFNTELLMFTSKSEIQFVWQWKGQNQILVHQFHFYISFCRKAVSVHRSVSECHINVSMISQFYCGFLFFLFFFNHILQRSFIHILPHLGVIFKKHHIANENVAFLYTRLTKIRQSINNYHINNYHNCRYCDII